MSNFLMEMRMMTTYFYINYFYNLMIYVCLSLSSILQVGCSSDSEPTFARISQWNSSLQWRAFPNFPYISYMLLASNLFPASFYTVIASCTGEPHFTDKDEHGNTQSLISSLDSPLGSRHVQERTQKRLCHQPHNHTHSTKEYSRSLSLPITRCYVVVTFSDLCFFLSQHAPRTA